MSAVNDYPGLEPARISNSELINYEANFFDDLIGEVWQMCNENNPAYEQWYRKHASVGSSPEGTRVIAWKNGQPFDPQFLHFRSFDTARMLPMHCAEFRTQWWAHASFWQKVERAAVSQERSTADSKSSIAMKLTMFIVSSLECHSCLRFLR
jgi:hypothetical protein